jgi:hypothetical protein
MNKSDELKPSGKVHPVAELFPMLSDDELNELADDIKLNGLLQPIVLDEKGDLVDGRNRLEACRRAKVKPIYASLNGIDPIAYIFSSNHKRRHMKQSQRAMLAAKTRKAQGWDQKIIDPKNFISQPEMAKLAGVTPGSLGWACVVLEYAPEYVDGVIAGPSSLDVAYKEAQDRKAAANSKEQQMEKLRKEAPDLADQVVEERLKLNEAYVVLKERKDEERREQVRSTELLRDIVLILDHRATDPKDYAETFINNFVPKFSTEEITKERLTKCLSVLKEITKQWRTEIYDVSARN